jgi:hypothetical protein
MGSLNSGRKRKENIGRRAGHFWLSLTEIGHPHRGDGFEQE